VIKTSLFKLALLLGGGGVLVLILAGLSLFALAIAVFVVIKAWSIVMTMLGASKKLGFE
jgi:hypothetical protein